MKKSIFMLLWVALFWLAACSAPPTAEPTAIPLPSRTPTITPEPTGTATPTPRPSATATRTPTSLPSATPTETPTPTPAQPVAVVQQQAHCRYGPGTAYLHSHDLYPGDQGVIDGKNVDGSWLWIQPAGLERHCWVALSVVEVQGDTADLLVVTSKLPYSNLYGPPEDVQAVREGRRVIISWNRINFTQDDDRGYMLRVMVCNNGRLETQTIQTFETSVTVVDEPGCAETSSGTLWGVEKHGYTQPVEIPWPGA